MWQSAAPWLCGPLPDQRTTELQRAGMSCLSAICPCCHQMGISSRGALSGPGRRYRELSLGPACGAVLEALSREKQTAKMGLQLPPGPNHTGTTGASLEDPYPVAHFQYWIPQQPATPGLLTHSTGAWESQAPFSGHLLVAMASCATACLMGWMLWQQLPIAWLSLHQHSCPAQWWAGEEQVKYLPHCWPRFVLETILQQAQ